MIFFFSLNLLILFNISKMCLLQANPIGHSNSSFPHFNSILIYITWAFWMVSVHWEWLCITVFFIVTASSMPSSNVCLAFELSFHVSLGSFPGLFEFCSVVLLILRLRIMIIRISSCPKSVCWIRGVNWFGLSRKS